jgi:hypothetical protein
LWCLYQPHSLTPFICFTLNVRVSVLLRGDQQTQKPWSHFQRSKSLWRAGRVLGNGPVKTFNRSLETQMNLSTNFYNISPAKIDPFKPVDRFLSGEIMYKSLSESPVIYENTYSPYVRYWFTFDCFGASYAIYRNLRYVKSPLSKKLVFSCKKVLPAR